MPSVSNESPAVNYVDYFTKQFPKDLAQMAQLRDELAQRQGALTAVADANKLKEDAQAYSEGIKAAADSLAEDTKAKNAEAANVLAAAKSQQKDLDARSAAFEKDSVAREKAVSAREKFVADREELLNKKDADLQAKQAALQAAQEALDARVKAFQAKVAALQA